MCYKRQAIRDVGKFKEVLRDRPSHSDGGNPHTQTSNLDCKGIEGNDTTQLSGIVI